MGFQNVAGHFAKSVDQECAWQKYNATRRIPGETPENIIFRNMKRNQSLGKISR